MEGEQNGAPRKGIYLLPNLLTTGGLFGGFYSIVAAIDGNFQAAALSIFVAMFLDGLDGRVARMTSTASDFGKEFDSLADMVSFGLAPAIVTYQWGVERLSEYGAIWGRLGWLAAFLYAAAAAFRLARFNTNVSLQDKRYFQGLASPAAAAGVASMVWVSDVYGIEGLVGLVAGIAITAIAGLLMMSRFSYLSFKEIGPGQRVKFTRLLLIPLVIIAIAIDPPLMVFLLFVTYASSGPVMWGLRRRRAAAEWEAANTRTTDPPAPPLEESPPAEAAPSADDSATSADLSAPPADESATSAKPSAPRDNSAGPSADPR